MHNQTSTRRRGFTLLEMLVTIALVVVLMLAVTQIFSIASQTISGGQALGSAVRDAQSAQPVFARDFASVAPDAACVNIYMGRLGAFRNREDMESNRGDPNTMTIDLDGDGTLETTISPLAINLRNHRNDAIMFFARDRFPRQTGNNGKLIADMTSNEAAIFYHLLQLPDNNLAFSNNTYPAQGNPNSNPKNYFSNQWVLGRTAMLLIEPIGGKIYEKPLTLTGEQEYIKRTSSTANDLTPLSLGSPSNNATATIEQSRFDLAGTSIDGYRQILDAYIGNVANVNKTWWLDIMGLGNRFQASVVAPRPLTAASAAVQVPIFVPSCSQFIVDFAGDFVTQLQDGSVSAAVPDGVIDFVAGTHQVRWYGLPRDTNGDGRIRGIDGDVVPVCDVAGGAMQFEHAWPTSGTTAPTSVPALDKDYLTQVTALKPDPSYIVAWPPKPAESQINDANQRWKFFRPQMIRITLGIDRPEGHLPDGPSFEYVFKVGQ
jgi:prepilin-type N-terminal cleavage/methylation domain-containing protein